MTTAATATVATGATWAAITALIERHGGRCTDRNGTTRYFRVPSPTGGTFLVEVTLRPRWCTVTIDRWRTTDLDERRAAAWLREHVWPQVIRAQHDQGARYAWLPNGGPTINTARPIDRCDLLDVLAAWVAVELEWGIPAQPPTAESAQSAEPRSVSHCADTADSAATQAARRGTAT